MGDTLDDITLNGGECEEIESIWENKVGKWFDTISEYYKLHPDEIDEIGKPSK